MIWTGANHMNAFEESLNSLLVDTFNNILKFEEKSLRSISGMSVTVTEAHILEAIGKNGGSASVSEISALLRVTLPTVTVAIKKLEQKGLIEKAPCLRDGRRSIVSLSELGKKLDRAHGIFHHKMVKDISRGLTEDEKTVLLSGIRKLATFFQEKVEAN